MTSAYHTATQPHLTRAAVIAAQRNGRPEGVFSR